jgi:hypothetical protein
MICNILTYLNTIPSITRDKTNTNGRGEGTYRQHLLDYEYRGIGTKDKVSKALEGMRDNNTGKWDAKHRNFVNQAYPRCVAFASGNASSGTFALPANAPLSSDLHLRRFKLATAPTSPSGHHDISHAGSASSNSNALAQMNNSLPDAIADCAGTGRLDINQIVALRSQLGIPLGAPFPASTDTLDAILEFLGLSQRGVIVYNLGHTRVDQSSTYSNEALAIMYRHSEFYPIYKNTPPDTMED